MTSRDFCYWLMGFMELKKADSYMAERGIGAAQMDLIERHLALVFAHEIDPCAGDAAHQQKLNDIHGPAAPGLDNKILRC